MRSSSSTFASVALILAASLVAPRASAQEPPPDLPGAPPATPPPVAPPPVAPPPPIVAPGGYVPPPYVPPAYAPIAPMAPPVVADHPSSGITGNWYGWQTLIAIAPFDIAMFTGLAEGNGTGATAAFWTGFIGRGVAPAVVHMAHQNWGKAFGTLGLHVGMSTAGLAIAYGIGIARTPPCPALAACRNNFEGIPSGIVYGAVVGSMSATILDVVFFAYRQKLSWTASAPAIPTKSSWAFAPYVAPEPGGRRGGVAASGTF